MRVRAMEAVSGRVYSGYYNLVRRKPGDVFDLLDDKHFSETWMEKVTGTTLKTHAPGEPQYDDLVADGMITEPRKPGRPRNS